MCRSIKPLFNFEPPSTEAEIEAAARQYVRKISGSRKPSKANTDAYEQAVAEIARSTQKLLDSLVTQAPKRDRAVEAAKAKAKAAARYGPR